MSAPAAPRRMASASAFASLPPPNTVTSVVLDGMNGNSWSMKLAITSRPFAFAIAWIAGLSTAAGIPRFTKLRSCEDRSCRGSTGTYPVPLSHDVNGAQTIVEPTPFASLAPSAVYRIAAFAAGGASGVGDVGESVLEPHRARPNATIATMVAGARGWRVRI